MIDHFSVPPLRPTPQLATLLDVTLRDGGFEVGFHWPPDLLPQVVATAATVGMDVAEIGYLGGVPLEHGVDTPGIGAFITPELVKSCTRDGIRLAAMIHPTALSSGIALEDYAAAGLAMVRLVYHPDWAQQIVRIAGQARACGLMTTVNIALASRYSAAELARHAAAICIDAQPDVLYVADTCGAMYPHEVNSLVGQLVAVTGTKIGFHAHDFLSLAYANALAACEAGATFFDASILGLGRGGGNLRTELVAVPHRLPASLTHEGIQRLIGCRDRLAQLAGHQSSSLMPLVCGALNLTPVEEAALTDAAVGQGVDGSVAALLFAVSGLDHTALRPGAGAPAWLAGP